MRILFVLALTSLVRHFESVILRLASRGHTVLIATPSHETNWPLPEALRTRPRIAEVTCPEGRSDEWAQSARLLRLMVDYNRFLEPAFAEAERLRTRARTELIQALTDGQAARLSARCPSCNHKIVNDAFAGLVLSGVAPGAGNLKRLMGLTERAIPSDPAHDQFLQEQKPDVVLVTPLIALGSPQVEWVKSARKAGVPIGFPVFSWDNLTTKGLIHEHPDRVFVWNDIQKREAVEYHGISPEAVEITGAPRFDAFCRLTPKRDRAKFCDRYGLTADRPIVTYLCSSELVAGREAEFVVRWISELRQDPALEACNIVVRPHPRSESQWKLVDLSAFPRVALTMPKQMNADRLLYDTLYHSAAVVGLNTSAQIEAGLLDKPVLTLLAPGFERGQQGTLHFRYLLADHGGFVQVASAFDGHRRQLGDAIAGRHDITAQRAFLERFVRPAGRDRPATPLLADAIERLHAGRQPRVRRWWSTLRA